MAILCQVFLEVIEEIRNIDSFLSGGVTVADGDGVVLEGLVVDSDTERGADFVVGVVAFADVTTLVQHSWELGL